MKTLEKWKVQDSSELYGVPHWGKGYFSVNESGHLQVHPYKDPSQVIDLKRLIDDLETRGIGLPVLLRFPQLLDHRLQEISQAFQQAISENEYQNGYACIYPIKVNQQANVVAEYLAHGKEHGFGIEAGSKAELLAVIALVDDNDTPIVCNGFKDSEYIETVILARKLGRNIIPIVERFTELEMIVYHAERHNVKPQIGLRGKLSLRGAGRWETSTGVRSKFGLTYPELQSAVEYLSDRGMAECLNLLHFHMGSQVSNIRALKAAISEIACIYGELHKAGATMQYLDVGGGLGVDYDGSQTNFASSMNYTLQEYANDIIFRVKTVCDRMEVPHPKILSESGRAVIAYHSMLIFNVLGTSSPGSAEEVRDPGEDVPQPLRDLFDAHHTINPRSLMESYHDVVQAREDAINLFSLGYMNLAQRAETERLFWTNLHKIARLTKDIPTTPDELAGLEELLAETYFCNFSLFQSMPDSWAISQLFPIMPIHRLDEEPRRRGVLADITCDSDGKVDQFIDLRDVKKTLELHEFDGGEYYLGAFLIGAYQEILGDLHNLFGDTNAVHVSIDENDQIVLENVVTGDTVAEVLAYVQYDPKDLITGMRREIERSLREKRLTLEESGLLQRFYVSGMNGYTYLEEPRSQGE